MVFGCVRYQWQQVAPIDLPGRFELAMGNSPGASEFRTFQQRSAGMQFWGRTHQRV